MKVNMQNKTRISKQMDIKVFKSDEMGFRLNEANYGWKILSDCKSGKRSEIWR